MSLLAELFSSGTFAATLRMATPLTLAALGGLLCFRVGIINIGLEGSMLFGAFFGIAFVDLSGGSVWVGLLAAMVLCSAINAIYALFVVNFKSNQIIAGVAINILAAGCTSFGLRAFFDSKGSVRPKNIDKLSPVDIPTLNGAPGVGEVINKHSPITYFALLLVAVTAVIIGRTNFGLRLCSVGENPVAAMSAGVSPKRMQWQACLISGAVCGLGGAYLSTEIVSQFSEHMVAGRGFNAFTAVIFGGAGVLATWLVTLLFAFADAVGIRLELLGLGISPSVIKMFPFILAIAALVGSAYVKQLRQSGRLQLRSPKRALKVKVQKLPDEEVRE